MRGSLSGVAVLAGLQLLLAQTAPAAGDGPNAEVLARDFSKPPRALKSVPLWHMNGALTTEGIESQLRDARDKSGFAGVAVLPVKETEPAYLGDPYFARYGDILEASKRLGVKVVFYDDVGFPSGSAGGLMGKRFPDDTVCRLDHVEADVTGPVAWEQVLPEGVFMGAVAMNRQSKERRDISDAARDGRVVWNVPAGTWKVMVFTCVRTSRFVDYLCPESVDKFFSLTYDEYYKRFAPHFGTTIAMTFFDDVGVRSSDRRVWTPGFNEKFQKKHGFSPVPLYPALWHDIGPDTEAARVALFGFRAELMSEGYPRKVHEWAAAHGIQSSGHAMGQYHPQPAFLGGDHMLFYRHSDIPMIDSIHYYGHGRPGFKLTSSAASCYDRPLTAVELYGNYKTFDAAMLYRSGMELFARGANLILPHGMWYDPQKVRIKPLISHFDPQVGPELSRYNDWVGRTSLLLQGGRHVADIGVLYPVAAMQAHARLDAVVDQPKVPGNVHPGLYVPPLTDLNEVSDCLTGELRRDFTFLHPDVLNTRCSIDGPLLRLNNATNREAYRVLLLPSARVLHADNAKRLQAFVEAGGRVVVTTQLPAKSAELGRDAEVAAALRALFGDRPVDVEQRPYVKHAHPSGGAAYFVPRATGAALGAALDDALPVPDVRFEQSGRAVAPVTPAQSAPGNTVGVTTAQGMLSYLHKVKDGQNIFYFANSTDEAVDTVVTLRGQHALQRWDPLDGSMSAEEASESVEGGVSCTRVRLRLAPVRAVFLVSAAAAERVVVEPPRLERRPVPESVMQSVYEEVKTPFKYGIVIKPEPGKKVDCPAVFRHGDLWYMMYIVFDGAGYETAIAESPDLLAWKPLGKILTFREGTWDAQQVAGYVALQDHAWGGSGRLQRFDGKYWLSYLGGALKGYETDPLSIGIAWTSEPDTPAEWTRLEQPVLTRDQPDCRDFERLTQYKSNIIWDKDERLGYPFVMYYNAKKASGYERIGMAVSKDMKTWLRFGKEPVVDNGKGISGDPQVVKIGDVWVMFYFGAFWKPGAFDTFACSYDLVSWTKWAGPHLVEPSESWDKQYAHKPWMVKHGGVVYHFYCATGDQGRVIALATSKDLKK